MVGCLVLVLGFGSSSALAAAYGIAVTGTMAITSMLFYRVAVAALGMAAPGSPLLLAVFMVFDVAFLVAPTRPRCSTAAGSRCRSASRCSRS
jgi:KUP system potassium uptake protein